MQTIPLAKVKHEAKIRVDGIIPLCFEQKKFKTREDAEAFIATIISQGHKPGDIYKLETDGKITITHRKMNFLYLLLG